MESSRGILIPSSTPPLPSSFADANGQEGRRTSGGVRWRAWAVVLAVVALLVGAAVFGASRVDRDAVASSVPSTADHGLSEKTSGTNSVNGGFPWSNAMLQWQRTGFHFQPEKNYMNDPNGSVYYRGWYHFFYQHNPGGTGWGNISWGHAVSRDMVHWRHLPLAMVPDHWYDIEGGLTGSITVLPDGRVILLYTGNTKTVADRIGALEANRPWNRDSDRRPRQGMRCGTQVEGQQQVARAQQARHSSRLPKFHEKIASIPSTTSAMAYLPSNKASVLIYQTQTNSIAYLPLAVSLVLTQSGKWLK